MSINIFLLLITILSFMIICFVHYITSFYRIKWYLKITDSYWFWFILSLFCLIYFIAGKWQFDIRKYFDSNLNYLKDNLPFYYSFYTSKLFLIDLCPFMSLFLPLTLIIDKTKNISKSISPFAIIGMGSTLFVALQVNSFGENINWSEFIFLGIGLNKMFFMHHFLTLILATMVILNAKTFTKWSFFGNFIFISLFIIYVVILKNTLNLTNNVTGLSIGDWIIPKNNMYWSAQYNFLYNAIKMGFPWYIIFWYMVALILNWIIIFIKNFLTKNPYKMSKNYKTQYIMSNFFSVNYNKLKFFIKKNLIKK